MDAALEGQWHKVMEARVAVTCATEMVILRDWLPRQRERPIMENLLAEDAGVRGNRAEGVSPTWGDARLVLMATLCNCLELLKYAMEQEQ